MNLTENTTVDSILILGMHRSGTSAVTRILNLMGMGLGGNLLDPKKDNVTGFWEQRDIVDLNDRLLNSLGYEWGDVRDLNDQWWISDIVQPFRDEIKEIIRREFDDTFLWGMKDPRICRLLPLYLSIIQDLNRMPGCILVLRNPLEVAESLRVRDGMGLEKTLLLWLKYMLEAERNSRGVARAWLSYDYLLRDWNSSMEHVVTALALNKATLNFDIDKEVEAFLDAGLRHHHVDELSDISFLTTGWVKAVYQVMSAATFSHNDVDTTLLDQVYSEMREAKLLFEPIVGEFIADNKLCKKELGSLRGGIDERNDVISQLHSDAASLNESLGALQDGVNDRDYTIVELRSESISLNESLGALQDGVNDRDHTIVELRSESISLNESLGALQDGVNDRDNNIIQLRSDIVTANRDIGALKGSIKDHEAAIEERDQSIRVKKIRVGQLETDLANKNRLLESIRGSISWRLTMPLRVLARLLRHGFNYPEPGAGANKNALRFAMAISWYKNYGLLFLLKEIGKRVYKKKLCVSAIQEEIPTPKNEYARLTLPKCRKPQVSIVIPVYNKFEFTYVCIQSVLEQTDSEYEVIVVDDGSSDLTKKIKQFIKGIKLVRNKENLGFIGSCNAGAEIASGDYVLFLNNDTIVKKGWLSSMLSCFELFPDTGMVGSKLIYPDGRMQEAGGIIWSDASGWNFGRLDDVDRPEYNYVRRVDYCSGASIILPLQLFCELGCFDSRYKPAYYEDTDLAFAVRAVGRQVIYQPFSHVVHFEGVSSGTDLNLGAKRYQTINKDKFQDKWKDVLATHQLADSSPLLAKDHLYEKRVLIIDSYTPMPDQDSGSLRMFRILKVLVRMGCKVSFLPENVAFIDTYTSDLQAVGVEAMYHPYISSINSYLEEFGKDFDLVIVSRRDVAQTHIAKVLECCPNAKTVFDTVDLHFVRESREQKLGESGSSGCGYDPHRMNQELELAHMVDSVWVVSAAEKELLHEVAADLDVNVISNIHDINPTPAKFDARKGILFIGSFAHTPNIDAVKYFVEEVFPLVCESLGKIEFAIIGAKPPKYIQHYAETFKNIKVLGHVENIIPCFEQARLSVAPLRYGAGVKGKINTSMSLGVPVVCTTIGAEGMYLTHGEDCMIADAPAAFANAIVEAYSNPDLWARLAENGLLNVQTYFSFDKVEQALGECVKSI